MLEFTPYPIPSLLPLPVFWIVLDNTPPLWLPYPSMFSLILIHCLDPCINSMGIQSDAMFHQYPPLPWCVAYSHGISMMLLLMPQLGIILSIYVIDPINPTHPNFHPSYLQWLLLPWMVRNHHKWCVHSWLSYSQIMAMGHYVSKLRNWNHAMSIWYHHKMVIHPIQLVVSHSWNYPKSETPIDSSDSPPLVSLPNQIWITPPHPMSQSTLDSSDLITISMYYSCGMSIDYHPSIHHLQACTVALHMMPSMEL